MLKAVISYLLLLHCLMAVGQRQYAVGSVLASGNWCKIGVKEQGVYKVDAALLNTLGLGSSLPSAAIRLYGNGGAMLGENANAPYTDDLAENAIEMVDGGDGVFSGNDYFLFYAPGVSIWLKDSLRQGFRYQKNLYSDSAYYYITVGGSGKRIAIQPSFNTAQVSVTDYDERFVYENDLVNLIGSGKEWYGDKWSASQSRSFSVDWPGLSPQQPVLLRASFASRNVNGSAGMLSNINGTNGSLLNFPAITGTFLDRFATHLEQEQNFNINGQSNLLIKFDYQSAASGAECWINRFEVLGRRALQFSATASFYFRDWRSVAANTIASFQLPTLLPDMRVWDITDSRSVVAMRNNGSTGFRFYNDASRLREYVAFVPSQWLTPVALGKVANQNLHGMVVPEYLIITHPQFTQAADQLAAFHRQYYQRTVQVVSTDQVYQEFGSGTADPAAIRDFIKMLYDKKSGLKYVLLMGSGSYDPKNRISNNYRFIPTYQSAQSLDPLSSFTSDDFFGLLDDSDDVNAGNVLQTVDVAVGRIPARSAAEANRMVTKIIAYHQPNRFGDWRNKLIFLADDKDQNLHLTDAEAVSAANTNPLFQSQKIYLDAYPLVSGSGGNRFPAANEALVNAVNSGALILNYTGHGNHLRLAEEAVLSVDEVNRFQNASRLPLVVTASCDFYPFDDPSKNALGAQVLTGDTTGAIALLSTARLVFASSNRIINEYFIARALTPDQQTGRYLSLGEAVRIARNLSVTQAGEVLNTRKFILLGDPAMQLAFPKNSARITGIERMAVTGADTLRASRTYELSGDVQDLAGNRLKDFNGVVSVVLYDKERTVQTLGNDVSSPRTGFQQQSAILFKGLFTVDTGSFRFRIILPKDVSFQPGRGKLSLYAYNNTTDAAGADTGFVLVGNNTLPADTKGPDIRLFLNDTLFRNGGLTHESPLLIAYLSDSSGINTSGNGIGHDITLVIDDLIRDIRVLNEWYLSDLDSWQSGRIRFRLPVQTNGPHSLTLKAWDGANNSTVVKLDYVVDRQDRLTVTKLMNFPNPFRDRTRFSFEHNQPGKELKLEVQIYDLSGRLIKRLSGPYQTSGTRNIQVEWDGRDESGRKIQKAVYIYHVIIQSGNQKSMHAGQLILL